MIDAVSNVAEIRGKGAEKMVVLVDGDNVSLLGPGSKMKLLFFYFLQCCGTGIEFCKISVHTWELWQEDWMGCIGPYVVAASGHSNHCSEGGTLSYVCIYLRFFG